MIWQAATAVVLAAAATVAPVAAQAAAVTGQPGFCPDANGVTVVVDFNELGGGTVVRCAEGPQTSGLAALENAGFTFEGTQRWGNAFICRIQGKPGAETEACLNTPPASAYWSYWHAPNGGAWKYSDLGVLSRTPPNGSFEGWSFAKDKSSSAVPPPGIAPRRPQPPPPPAAPPPPAGGGGRPPAGAPPASVAASATAEPSPSVIASTVPASTVPATSVTPPTQEVVTAIAEPPRRPAGNPLGAIAAGVLLGGLAVAAVVLRRRRRVTPES